MVQASVGFHCPECAKSSSQRVVRGPAAFGLTGGKPVVTITLIAINVAVFVADLLTKGALTERGSLVGAIYDPRTGPVGVAFGEPWRIVTGGFLHAGYLHLGMNMLALWVLGSQLEPILGRLRFLALYVASLLAGAFAVLLVQPSAETVGASGAIFGLLAVAFVFQRSRGINPWRSGIGGLILINLVLTFAIPGISIAGHIGGLIGGAVGAFAVFEIEKRTPATAPAVAVCGVLAVLFGAGALWAAGNWMHPILGVLGR